MCARQDPDPLAVPVMFVDAEVKTVIKAGSRISTFGLPKDKSAGTRRPPIAKQTAIRMRLQGDMRYRYDIGFIKLMVSMNIKKAIIAHSDLIWTAPTFVDSQTSYSWMGG
jgi:hypothetical protein